VAKFKVLLLLSLTLCSALFGIDLNRIITQAMDDFEIPGAAIGVVMDGEVIFAKGYGYRDREQQLPVTTDTLFAIASCSKAFTTLLLGMLVEEGLVEWDQPVVTYIPEFRLWDGAVSGQITVRDLVTHRSGLPRHELTWYDSGLSRDELLGRLPFLDPVCGFRERVYYNNLTYMVAGVVAERVTGLSWEKLISSRIFAPLGMTESNCSVCELQKSADYSLPYGWRGGEIRRVPFRDLSNIGPAVSINSSLSNMLAWVSFQLGCESDDLVQPETLREMHSSHVVMHECPTYPIDPSELFTNYGLGWMLRAYRGHYNVYHNGSIDGFSTLVSLLPSDGIGVVILTNSRSMGNQLLMEALSKEIFSALLHLESEQRVDLALERWRYLLEMRVEDDPQEEQTHPSHALEAYVGHYHHKGYGSVGIELVDGQLYLSYHAVRAPLDHYHYDTFSGVCGFNDNPVWQWLRVTFYSDRRGTVCALTIPLEPNVGEVVFEKEQ